MHTAKLRSVGGSTMVAIPPHIIEALRLGPNSTVGLTLERGKSSSDLSRAGVASVSRRGWRCVISRSQ